MRLRQIIAAAFLAAAMAVAACGSTSTSSRSQAVKPTTPSAAAARPSAAHTAEGVSGEPGTPPTVHFQRTSRVFPQGTWAFSAQLARIESNPNGLPGSPGAPPQDTYLVVRVSIVSSTTGRAIPPPELGRRIACHGFRSVNGPGEPEDEGYDEGPETAPDNQGFNVALGDGRPHLWDQEYLVPATTPTALAKCVFLHEAAPSHEVSVRAVGPTELN
jgi:hypothetical protein